MMFQILSRIFFHRIFGTRILKVGLMFPKMVKLNPITPHQVTDRSSPEAKSTQADSHFFVPPSPGNVSDTVVQPK